MARSRAVAYTILISLLAYILAIGIYGDALAIFASQQDSIFQLILYYLTQTQFVIIFIGALYVGILRKRVVGGIGAGILIDIASDMNSTPHCVLSTGFVQNAPNLTLCSDTIYIHWLSAIMPFSWAYNLYYWIIPAIFVVVAFEMLGITGFLKYFRGGK